MDQSWKNERHINEEYEIRIFEFLQYTQKHAILGNMTYFVLVFVVLIKYVMTWA